MALYDRGEAPLRVKEDEKKALRREIVNVRMEFEEAEGEFEGLFGAEYEGRRGASPPATGPGGRGVKGIERDFAIAVEGLSKTYPPPRRSRRTLRALIRGERFPDMLTFHEVAPLIAASEDRLQRVLELVGAPFTGELLQALAQHMGPDLLEPGRVHGLGAERSHSQGGGLFRQPRTR